MTTEPVRLLVLSFYFRPDLSAGSFRITALVDALRQKLPEGSTIEVITTQPNRYASYSAEAPLQEQYESLTIRRVPLPPHQSGMVDQSRAFGVFARRVWQLTKSQPYDLVFASTSRLMTGVLGSAIARRQGAPLYLDIRDIFTETMREVLGRSPIRAAMPLFDGLERWALRPADRVNLVSPGFVEHFADKVGSGRLSHFTNGIDPEFLERDFRSSTRQKGSEKLILYAGNLGDGQGLHRVVPEAAKRLEGEARFCLIGDGGKRGELEEGLTREGVSNVELRDPVPRTELLDLYARADILFLHLNNYRAFRRVLPSKLFEYAATEKPVLAGVAGSSATFLNREVPGAAIFPPCNAEELVTAFRRLTSDRVERRSFRQRFDRRTLMAEMAEDVISLV